MRPFRDPRFRRAAWTVLGVVGWAGLVWIGAMLASLDPPRVGDDLRLLLDAARRLVDGEALYSAVPAGASLEAESLFYSYPPPVAQALAPLSGLPFSLVLLLWAGGAVGGLALVARRLGRPAGDVVLPALALAPYVFPFAVALLMGNLNAWFPLVFGLLLAALLAGGRGPSLAGGVALAVASVAKLHPASLGLWLLVRAGRLRRSEPELAILGAAAVAGTVMISASLLLGGTDPWSDYAAFLRSGAAATDLVSPLNVGPASQIALLLGLDDAAARMIQPWVTAGALAVTVAAGWLVRDQVASFGWATAASLVVLPVTWVHYPVALFPVALASAARARSDTGMLVGILLVAAIVSAALALLVPVVTWVAVGLVLAAAHVSGRPGAGTE